MKKLLLSSLAVLALALPVAALAESWNDVTLIDQMCGAKFKANPDEHPVTCLKKCAKGGLGIITSDGTWLKLDPAGNKQAIAALDKTSKKDHIRVNVTGEKKGDMVQVATLALAE